MLIATIALGDRFWARINSMLVIGTIWSVMGLIQVDSDRTGVMWFGSNDR